MQKSENPQVEQEISVLLFDEFSNHCLANTIEPFRAANTIARKSLYKWTFLSLAGGTITSSSGLPVQTDAWGKNGERGDILFVMPSYGFLGYATPRMSEILRAALRRFATIVGLDTGAWLLAAAGLLYNRKATIHWDEIARFGEAFPSVDVVPDRFVLDGRVATCGGASTAFELVLDLISRDHSPMLALEVAANFMHGERPDPGHMQALKTSDAIVHRATTLMRKNMEEPLSIPDLARVLKIEQRQLEDRFRQKMDLTPARVYKAIRLREARRLVELTTLGIAEIATRCGYQDASAMTRAYRLEFGTAPRGHRSGN
ncbi:transcriptional regulator [Roseibium sp. TrichSKD4]|uniref:GlxA family transcriptional regulator n=1 Tax=Roseibium sp. TrichSKD4 TaxID=744980 RepID=UPI0001E575BC|nr:helix-turn-helix domain-containing protein [Roseibium sp. TrichSKD4]EFO29399.1 transcriptional regulator [Roseibium sp. TrichSKD4]